MTDKLKMCNKCNCEKSLELFNFNKRSKDGRDYLCKSCHSIAMKARRAADPEKYKEMDKAWRNKNIEKHRASSAAWAKANPERVKENKRRNVEQNLERHKEYHRNYRERNKEKIKRRQKEYYKKNCETFKENRKIYYKNNPEKVKKVNKKWADANPDKCRVIRSRRETRKMNQYHPEHDINIEKRYDKLVRILRDRYNVDYHVDHIWPLSKGGPHHHDNLQVITQSINNQKKDRMTFIHKDSKNWTDLPHHILMWVKDNKKKDFKLAVGEIIDSGLFTNTQIRKLLG